jgi:hypothetical protein
MRWVWRSSVIDSDDVDAWPRMALRTFSGTPAARR